MSEKIDVVNNPKHYKSDQMVGIECIDITRHLSFNRGNAFKYVWRAGRKGGAAKAVEDLSKALWYVNDGFGRGIFEEVADAALAIFKLLPEPDGSDSLYAWRHIALRSILYDLATAEAAIRGLMKRFEQMASTPGKDDGTIATDVPPKEDERPWDMRFYCDGGTCIIKTKYRDWASRDLGALLEDADRHFRENCQHHWLVDGIRKCMEILRANVCFDWCGGEYRYWVNGNKAASGRISVTKTDDGALEFRIRVMEDGNEQSE